MDNLTKSQNSHKRKFMAVLRFGESVILSARVIVSPIQSNRKQLDAVPITGTSIEAYPEENKP